MRAVTRTGVRYAGGVNVLEDWGRIRSISDFLVGSAHCVPWWNPGFSRENRTRWYWNAHPLGGDGTGREGLPSQTTRRDGKQKEERLSATFPSRLRRIINTRSVRFPCRSIPSSREIPTDNPQKNIVSRRAFRASDAFTCEQWIYRRFQLFGTMHVSIRGSDRNIR